MDIKKIQTPLVIGALGIGGILLYLYMSKRQQTQSEQPEYIPVFASGSSGGVATGIPSSGFTPNQTGNSNSVPSSNIPTKPAYLDSIDALAKQLGFVVSTYSPVYAQDYPYMTNFGANPLAIASYVFGDRSSAQKVYENLDKHYSVYLDAQTKAQYLADAKTRLGLN